MPAACGRCGRAILPGTGIQTAPGAFLCELCALGPGTVAIARLRGSAEDPGEPDALEPVRALSFSLRRASRAAAHVSRDAAGDGALAAEDAAILAIVAERDAGDVLSQGGTPAESLAAVARAARATADALDAAAEAIRTARR
jgi:hypothetical protein